MDPSSQGQLLDTEEALLAAQQSFMQGKEALSVQFKVKRPSKQIGTPESTKKALKPTGVTWAPEVTGGEETSAAQDGEEAIAEEVPKRSAFPLGGQEGPENVVSAPVRVNKKPIKVLTSLPTGPSVRAASGDFKEQQLHPRIGPGTDLTGDDEVDCSSDASIDDHGSDRAVGGEERPPYEPLPTVGAIKEKGYGGGGFKVGPLPAPRVTPFPEARHRSEGPHCGPASYNVVEHQPLDSDSAPPFDPATAIPLSRSKPAKKTKASISKFRQALLETRNQGGTSSIVTGAGEESAWAVDTRPESEGGALGGNMGSVKRLLGTSYGDDAALRVDSWEEPEATEPRARQSAGVSEEDSIDAENRARLTMMSAAEVAEEQAELQQMLPPGVLEALRKRGAQKLGNSAPGNAETCTRGPERGSAVARDRDEGLAYEGEPQKGAIRRQPTPLPGAIPTVRKGPKDSLGAISESGGETDSSVKVVTFAIEGNDRGIAGSRGGIRRQPTPHPGAISAVQTEASDGLDAIDEVNGTEASEQDGGFLSSEGDGQGVQAKAGTLQRLSTPHPGAIPVVRRGPTNELESIGETDSVDVLTEDTLVSGAGIEMLRTVRDKGGLRRQPTPLPGAIPAVQKGPLSDLGAISETEVAEPPTVAHGVPTGGNSPLEGQTGGGSLRRQPTPLPGAIPTSVKKRASELPALAEEDSEGGLDSTAENAQAKSRLLRQPTPMPGALLPGKQELASAEELDPVAEEDEETDPLAGEQDVGTSGRGRGEAPGMPRAGSGRRPLHRQSTPMPGAIPTETEMFAPGLDALKEEEGEEEEEGDERAEVDRTRTTGRRTGRLKRQPTPYPAAITGSLSEAEPALAAVNEEESEEEMGLKGDSPVGEEQAATVSLLTPATNPVPETSPRSFEQVKASDLRFALDGSLLALKTKQGPGHADVSAPSEKAVAQRDILRSEGDPSGAGYTLREAAALARSTVPGQRAAALRLLAAVLKRASAGVYGNEGKEDRVAWEGVWARVWEYALGPDVQLAVLLRSALDDSHASVLAAATLALTAALTCDENEALFADRGALWTGPGQRLCVSTGPCERSWGVLTAGVGNWGRWTAKSDVSPGVQSDEGGESVGDDARVAAADLVAGLIRMGVLPRIRFILEVLSLPALDEPLLGVLLAFCRHSPVAAAAVRDCPRLMPTLQTVFIGLPAPEVRPAVPSQSVQAKAVKLLGVLSSVGRPFAAAVCTSGLLQLAKRHLSSTSQGPPHYPPAFPEVLRLWRTCALYELGGNSFSDYYAPLSFVLEAPTGGKSAGKSYPWKESTEAYLLLEAVARLLPNGPDTVTDGSEANQGRKILMDWQTVGPLVETAAQWLRPALVGSLFEGRTSTGGVAGAPALRALAAVLHFLATVCERNEGQLGRLERTVVDALLARGGVLLPGGSDSNGGGEYSSQKGEQAAGPVPINDGQESYAFRCLSDAIVAAGDCGDALAAASCLQGLHRLTSALAARERLGAKVLESSGEGTEGLRRGRLESSSVLVPEEAGETQRVGSIKAVFASQFAGLAEKITEFFAVSNRVGDEEKSGVVASAGVGLGWGWAGREVWADGAESQRARADLLARLYETLPLATDAGRSAIADGRRAVRGPEEETAAAGGSEHLGQSRDGGGSERDSVGDGKGDGKRDGKSRLALRHLRAGLAAVRHARPGDFALVLSLLSSCVLEPGVLEVLLSEGALLLASLRRQSGTAHQERTDLPSAAEVRRVLLPHLASQWLGYTHGGADMGGDVAKFDGWDVEKEVHRVLEADVGGRGKDSSQASEGVSLRSMPGYPEPAMAAAVAGQKLPLPADWVLSPTAVAAQLASEASGSDVELGVKRLVRAGLALLLGFEAAERLELPGGQSGAGLSRATFLRVSLARKLHALSEVFLAAGELFLDPDIGPLLHALQSLFGEQLSDVRSTGKDASRKSSAAENAVAASSRPHPGLDFSAAVGAPYEKFAESLAEQFAATSFGDLVFGRQVALLLRSDVTPGELRLVVWRALADARALHLLPPAEDCMGDDPGAYSTPQEESKAALELYAATLSSGALDRTIASGFDNMSVSALLALHHLSAALADISVNRPSGGSVRSNGSGSDAAEESPKDVSASNAERKRWVLRLARGLLRSVAGGRCEATTLAALVSPSRNSVTNSGSPVEREGAVSALVEASAGDSALLTVLQTLGLPGPQNE